MTSSILSIANHVTTTLYSTDEWLSLTLSPDGTKVVYLSAVDCGCTQQVRVVDLTNDQVTVVTAEEPDYTYQTWNPLAWSPDGMRLALERHEVYSWQGDIVLADLSQPCPACTLSVLNGSQDSEYPVWSPDGVWIAASDIYDGNQLLLAADGSEQISINTDDYSSIYGPAWQPLPDCAPADPSAPMAFSGGGDYCAVPTPTPTPTLDPGLANRPVGFDEARYSDDRDDCYGFRANEEPSPDDPSTGHRVKCWVHQSIAEWLDEFPDKSPDRTFTHRQLIELIAASEYGSMIPLWINASSVSQRTWPDEALARRFYDWRYGCGLDGCQATQEPDELYIFLSTYQAPRNYTLDDAQDIVNLLSGRDDNDLGNPRSMMLTPFDRAVERIFNPSAPDDTVEFAGDASWLYGLEAPPNEPAPPHPYGWGTVTNVPNDSVANLTTMLSYCNEERFAVQLAGSCPDDGLKDIFFGVTIGNQGRQSPGGEVLCSFKQDAYQVTPPPCPSGGPG